MIFRDVELAFDECLVNDHLRDEIGELGRALSFHLLLHRLRDCAASDSTPTEMESSRLKDLERLASTGVNTPPMAKITNDRLHGTKSCYATQGHEVRTECRPPARSLLINAAAPSRVRLFVFRAGFKMLEAPNRVLSSHWRSATSGLMLPSGSTEIRPLSIAFWTAASATARWRAYARMLRFGIRLSPGQS